MNAFLEHRKVMAQLRHEAVVRNNFTKKREGFLRRWLRAVTHDWKRRKMVAALHALDDRLLRDIGIYRNDIERVVGEFDDRELRMAPLPRPSNANKERLPVGSMNALKL